MLSRFSLLTVATLWTLVHKDPLFIRFLRQEYWSGLLFPPPGDIPKPGVKPMSLKSPALAGVFFTTSSIWETTYQ